MRGGSRNFHLGRPVKGQANFGKAAGVVYVGMTRAIWVGQA